MALGKSSKKTTKAASEAPSKTKSAVAVTKAKSPVSTRRGKTTTAVAVDEPVQSATVIEEPVTSLVEPAKAMAASAGYSGTETSTAEHVAPVANNHVAQVAELNGLTHDSIARRAYHYWAERGYAHGYADEDWARAEAELKAR